MEDGLIGMFAEYALPTSVLTWYALFTLGSVTMHRRVRTRASSYFLCVALAPPIYYAIRFLIMTSAKLVLGNDSRIMIFHQYDSFFTLSFCFIWLLLSAGLFCLAAKSIPAHRTSH